MAAERPGVRGVVLRIFGAEDKASGRASRRRGAVLLLAAASLLALCWRRGLHRPDGRPELPRGSCTQADESSASCRAAALGSLPSKDELAALGRPLPQYMLKAADGDEVAALRRWAETLRWRCDIGDQALLSRPHPNLARIAPHYPQFLHLPDREGRLTYWELIGHINQAGLLKEGLTPADIVEHYIWNTLFTWDVAASDDASEVTIIVDMSGFSLSTLSPTVLSIFYRVAKLLRQHFPQREHGMYFINAPSWYMKAYNMVAPLVSQKQRERVRIFSSEATPGLLRSLIAPENLPREYGGTGAPLGASPLEERKRRLAAAGSL